MKTSKNSPKVKVKNQKISSGILMTVWQTLPQTPELQFMARQHEELEMVKNRLEMQEKRLKAVEDKVRKIEISYKSILKTLTTILEEEEE